MKYMKNHAGYELSKSRDLFTLKIENKKLNFTLHGLVREMDRLGFQLPDIEEGIVGLEIHGHKCAYYGITKSFMFFK